MIQSISSSAQTLIRNFQEYDESNVNKLTFLPIIGTICLIFNDLRLANQIQQTQDPAEKMRLHEKSVRMIHQWMYTNTLYSIAFGIVAGLWTFLGSKKLKLALSVASIVSSTSYATLTMPLVATLWYHQREIENIKGQLNPQQPAVVAVAAPVVGA